MSLYYTGDKNPFPGCNWIRPYHESFNSPPKLESKPLTDEDMRRIERYANEFFSAQAWATVGRKQDDDDSSETPMPSLSSIFD